MSNALDELTQYFEEHYRKDREDRFLRFNNLPTNIKAALLEAYKSKEGLALAIKTQPLLMVVQQLAIRLFMTQPAEESLAVFELRVAVQQWLRMNGWED